MPETRTAREIAETLPCRCGHPTGDHDAGECWAQVDGDRCSCVWYEPETAPERMAKTVRKAVATPENAQCEECGGPLDQDGWCLQECQPYT